MPLKVENIKMQSVYSTTQLSNNSRCLLQNDGRWLEHYRDQIATQDAFSGCMWCRECFFLLVPLPDLEQTIRLSQLQLCEPANLLHSHCSRMRSRGYQFCTVMLGKEAEVCDYCKPQGQTSVPHQGQQNPR